MEEDIRRKMVELALTSAKKRISPQTGLLHCWIEDPFHVRQDTIPTLENFLYVYALFRSKLVENIQGGKGILEQLLAFEVDGNFPVYLHEFPRCKDKQLSSHLLPPLFYLLRDFPLALGESWVKRLRSLSERIIKSLKAQEVLSMGAKARLLSFLGEFELGHWQPRTPSEWGDFCVCSQMSGLDVLDVSKLWDPTLGVFIGNAKEHLQEELEPAVTLLDLFMGMYFQQFSKRALVDHPAHLKASLVHPFEKRGELEREIPFRYLIEENQRQCLTIYWGSLEKVHSFVLEAKKGSFEIKEIAEGQLECLYTYDETVPSEEESVEFAFYLNDSKEHLIEIEEERATVFHPGDKVSITSDGIAINFQIQTDDVQGKWMGHILKGDRSYQKGHTLPYGGYDWKLGLRTLKRESSAQVKIILKITDSTHL